MLNDTGSSKQCQLCFTDSTHYLPHFTADSIVKKIVVLKNTIFRQSGVNIILPSKITDETKKMARCVITQNVLVSSYSRLV